MTAGEFVWELVVGAFDALCWPFDSGLSLKAWLALGALAATLAAIALFFFGRMAEGGILLGVGVLLGLGSFLSARKDGSAPYGD